MRDRRCLFSRAIRSHVRVTARRKRVSIALILGGMMCSCTLNASAQSPSESLAQQPAVRNYGGWQSGSASSSAPGSAQGRNAYFQTSGLPMAPTSLPPAAMNSLSGAPSPLPSLPSANYDSPSPYDSQVPGAAVQPAIAQASGLPTYEPFNNPGGMLPPTEVRQASDAQLRNAQVAHQGNVLPPNYRNNPAAAYQPTQYQPGNPGVAMPGVYPPGGYAPSAYQQPGYSQQVLPPQGPPQGYAQPNDPNYAAPQMRDAAVATAARQVNNSGIPVVSQDPRFISPPPRTGNYATLPYVSPYRTVAYQVPQATVPQVQTPTGLPTQPANVASTTSLPQYQPTVGVRPITYQSGYQAGYQYCAPGIPAGGVPQVVPGAVAPPTLPPNMAPQLYSPDNSGFKPLFSLGQENYNVQLGRGIIGQPTAYVPGQPVRNFLRYLSP